MTLMQRFSVAATLAALALSHLSGCGQKGPLKLPPSAAAASAPR